MHFHNMITTIPTLSWHVIVILVKKLSLIAFSTCDKSLSLNFHDNPSFLKNSRNNFCPSFSLPPSLLTAVQPKSENYHC